MSMGARGSNGRTSNQDYTNLLFSDSDSDSRVPDLKLPPVKGKRQKKKRGSSGYRGEEASCGIGSLMKVFLLLILFTVVAALAGISFWSMQKISSLQEKVDKLEQSEAFTPDSMTKFQTQLMSLNKTLTDVRSGTAGMKTSIEELRSQVKALEDVSEKLKGAVATSKEVLDLPEKFRGLVDVFANLNATAITSKQESLDSRLGALENDFKTFKMPDTESGKATQPDDQYIMEQLNLLNQTTNQALASIKLRQDQQETNVSKIEELINRSATSSPVAISLINKLVKDAMLEYMSNTTVPGSLPAGQIEGVIKQVDGIMEAMKQFKADRDSTIVTKGEFLLFKENVHSGFERVNKSLLAFNEDFESVTEQFQVLDSYMKNATKVNQVAGDEIGNGNGGTESLTSDSQEGGEEDVTAGTGVVTPNQSGEVTPSQSGVVTPSQSGVVTPSQSGGNDETIPTQPDNSKETTPTPSTTTSTSRGTSTTIGFDDATTTQE